jgi:hypothetical protein
MPAPPGMSPKDANQVLRAVMDDTENRLRVDAVISPDGSDLEIHYEDDSIAIGDPTSHNILAIESDGSIKQVQLFNEPFDAITATYPSDTQEVYQSRIGGISGTVQQTLTINYTDATKALLLNVART